MTMADVFHEDDENQNDEELIIVDDESLAQDEQGDDERVSQQNEVDDEREAIRERRRAEKAGRKERRDTAIKRDKVELDFLRKRNDDLERRLTAQEQRAHQGDLNNLDVQIQKTAQEAQMAERVIAKAVEAGNGEDVTQAMRYRDQALQKLNQLNQVKQHAAQVQPKQQQIDDITMSYAKEFLEENTWYDPQGRDEDSAIVLAIDQSLAREGISPQTEEYWDELRLRTAKRLPERFGKTEKAPRTARGGPAVGSGREHAPASTRKEIYISPERKAALIEAGVWDDQVLRMKYVKRYAEYDRNNKA
jgi:hypothetical protein